MIDPQTLPYRPAAGIMLLNRQGKVFVAQRIDNTLEAWQMPQGGLDEGEEEQAGALRELEEETGITAAQVEVVRRCPDYLYYDLPADMVGKVWKGHYRGQKQVWFLMRYLGTDDEIDIETAEPEFRAWRWADPDELPHLIVPFKKKLYQDVVEAFRNWL